MWKCVTRTNNGIASQVVMGKGKQESETKKMATSRVRLILGGGDFGRSRLTQENAVNFYAPVYCSRSISLVARPSVLLRFLQAVTKLSFCIFSSVLQHWMLSFPKATRRWMEP